MWINIFEFAFHAITVKKRNLFVNGLKQGKWYMVESYMYKNLCLLGILILQTYLWRLEWNLTHTLYWNGPSGSRSLPNQSLTYKCDPKILNWLWMIGNLNILKMSLVFRFILNHHQSSVHFSAIKWNLGTILSFTIDLISLLFHWNLQTNCS